jgi:hypothetical protein
LQVFTSSHPLFSGTAVKMLQDSGATSASPRQCAETVFDPQELSADAILVPLKFGRFELPPKQVGR